VDVEVETLITVNSCSTIKQGKKKRRHPRDLRPDAGATLWNDC